MSNFVCHVREGIDEETRERWREACKKLDFYREHEGKRYCVLHYPSEDKDEAQFQEALIKKRKNGDFNFSSAYFSGMQDFRGLTFGAGTNFNSATFSGGAAFSKATFEGSTNFLGTTFSGVADFSGATFEDVVFAKATFSDMAGFVGTTFKKEANFLGVNLGFVNAIDSIFKDRALFVGATFSGMTFFSGATFEKEANFLGATFNDSLQFLKGAFRGHARFEGVTFKEGAWFSEVTFVEESKFSTATFENRTVFDKCTFSRKADFTGATFKVVAFEDSTFSEAASFPVAVFEEARFVGSKTFNLQGVADFQDARIEQPDRFSFYRVKLRPSWFINVDARKFNFTSVQWYGLRNGHEGTVDKEIDILKDRKVESPNEVLAKACRQLASNAEENHEYPLANEFHYWSMEAQRKEIPRSNFAAWRLIWWYWALSGYGERHIRAAVWLIAILVGFSAFYMWLGPVGVQKNSLIGVLGAAWESIVYSLGVMTRLANDIPKSTSTLVTSLIIIEGVLGPLQIGLFLLALRREFMR